MAKSQILWTILPYGLQDGHRRVSVVVSPRLTPENDAETHLASDSYEDFHNWPATVLDNAVFRASIADRTVELKLVSEPDPKLWQKLFPEETRIDGFEFTDMSKVNILSYPIRSILSYLKAQYSRLAVESPLDYPVLLPWRNAEPGLKDMLEKAGTLEDEENKRGKFASGFNRFFDKGFTQPPFSMMTDVPSPNAEEAQNPAMSQTELRVMNPDWEKQEGRFKSALEYDLYRADRFYRRTRPTEDELKILRPDFKNIPDPPKEPDFDFHRIVASLADYPELMRRLGLVLDFILVQPPEAPNAGRMKLQIGWKNGHDPAADVTPWTAFIWEPLKQRFITASRTDEIKNGMLNMENSGDRYDPGSGAPYDVYQVDPDGAALKTVDFVITAQNLLNKGDYNEDSNSREITYTTDDRQGYAALRSGGLGVSHNGRALSVARDAAAAKLKNDSVESGNSGDITLFAEDVLLGYRVDVARVPDNLSPGSWQTLCARKGTYRLAKSGESLDLQPNDEGYVSGPSTTSGGPESRNPDDHYLHESLFRWTGWSLCVPQPGPAIMAEEANDSHIQSEAPCMIDDVAEKGTGVIANFKTPKGTLPRLRYGRLYRFRARTVDLAGNSFDCEDPALDAFTGASDAVGYWRYEPIDPPVVIHRARVSEGESLERMVIRSNYDVGADGYLLHEPFADAIRLEPAIRDFSYAAKNERHLVPPKSSQSQCERHGLFDLFFGDWKDFKKGYEIAARDELTLGDGSDRFYSDIEVVTPSALSGIATTSEAPRPPSEDNPVGDRMAGGQYIIHKEEQIIIPYLPDGAAGGIAIRAAAGHSLPGVKGACDLGPSCSIRIMPGLKYKEEFFVILVKHRLDWPNHLGFRLILAEVRPHSDPSGLTFADEPVWDEKKRTLTLFVPKGWIVRLLYSSYADAKHIDSFGILNWIDSDDKRKIARDYAYLYGANWLITPFRDLTLVHATQQPVFLPKFTKDLVLTREPGSHDVEFHKDTCVYLHGPSTGKFEVEAEWSEWVDDPSKDTPVLVNFKGQLDEIQLTENHIDEFNLADVIKARQKEANPQDLGTDVKRGNVHSLGDTRSRVIKYTILATTRFREYLPPSIYENQGLVTRLGPVATGPRVLLPVHDPEHPDPGAPVLCNPAGSNQQSLVPASAPPDDPRVLYVVPTMRWGDKQEYGGADAYDVLRAGNSLRVWLDRPWFSSGDGELLGIVIYQDNGLFSDIPKKPFESLVSQWGADPFWSSVPSKQRACVADFPACVTSEKVKLQETYETLNTQVMVIGHRVHYDYDKRLWYCDIEFGSDLSAYMPFVRLALVRYQPNAIETAKVSKVVLTDFAQVLPNRQVTVDKREEKIIVTLRGTNPSSGPMSKDSTEMPETEKHDKGRNRVELVLQRRDPAIDSDLAWTDNEIISTQIASDMKGDIIFNSEVALDRITNKGPLSRLMLREFERFYSDDVVYSSKKRVIEERLVFSYIFTV